MVKAKELVKLSMEELQGQYEDICRDIFHLTSELRVTRKLDKPHLLKAKKKDRARVLTVMSQLKNQGSIS